MKILVECFPDEALLRILGVPRKRLLHERSKGRIITWLMNLPDAMGMVDEDPGSTQHRDLGSYRETQSAQGLRRLARQGSGGQRLVVLRPRLDEWLIQRAKTSGIKPENFGLPANADRLHAKPHYETKPEFRRFIEQLMSRDVKGIGAASSVGAVGVIEGCLGW